MIPACKNRYVEQWFRGYVRSYLRRSFHRVLLAGELPPSPDGPLVVCVNHSSWWDMLFCFWLSRDVLDWDSYGPMDERQLRRYGILRRIGVFGVDRESLNGGREFLQYARELLGGEERRVIWMTAQGAMISNDERPVRFYGGVSHLVQALGRCQVMTAALDYEFWDEKRPEAFVSLGAPRTVEAGPGFSRKAFLRELEAELEQRMDRLDTLRRTRDAASFRELLSSRSGISPTYDLLRRFGARLAGAEYAEQHGQVVTPPRWGPAARENR